MQATLSWAIRCERRALIGAHQTAPTKSRDWATSANHCSWGSPDRPCHSFLPSNSWRCLSLRSLVMLLSTYVLQSLLKWCSYALRNSWKFSRRSRLRVSQATKKRCCTWPSKATSGSGSCRRLSTSTSLTWSKSWTMSSDLASVFHWDFRLNHMDWIRLDQIVYFYSFITLCYCAFCCCWLNRLDLDRRLKIYN